MKNTKLPNQNYEPSSKLIITQNDETLSTNNMSTLSTSLLGKNDDFYSQYDIPSKQNIFNTYGSPESNRIIINQSNKRSRLQLSRLTRDSNSSQLIQDSNEKHTSNSLFEKNSVIPFDLNPSHSLLTINEQQNNNHNHNHYHNDNKWKRLPGIKLKSIGPEKIVMKHKITLPINFSQHSFISSTPQLLMLMSTLEEEEDLTKKEKKQDVEENRERDVKSPKKVVDLLGIIGLNFEINKPRNFIEENCGKFTTRKKVPKKSPILYDYSKYEPQQFKIMNRIDNCIDGFYGDWKRDEFKNTRSLHKIQNYHELSSKKFFNKIFPKLPKDHLKYKIEIEPEESKKITDQLNQKFESKIKRTKKKPDPKLKYKRLTALQYNQLRKINSMDISIDDEKDQNTEKPIRTEEVLQFPVTQLGKEKYGGIVKLATKQQGNQVKPKYKLQAILESINNQNNGSNKEKDEEREDITDLNSVSISKTYKNLDDSTDMANNKSIRLNDSFNNYDSSEKKKMNPRFLKILKYVEKKDDGVINNTLPNILNNNDKLSSSIYNTKEYSKLNLYEKNTQYEEYQKLSQRIYDHNELNDDNNNTRNDTDEKIDDNNDNDSSLQKDTTIPIIKNIDDTSFILINYKLNEYMAKSLGQKLQTKKTLKNLIMVDNQLNDTSSKAFFIQMNDLLPKLIMFRFVKNIIGPKTVKILKKGLFSTSHNNLRELTLDSSDINPKDLCHLIEQAYCHRARIKYLGLSNIKLKAESLAHLGKFLADNDYLLSLDISWNNLSIEYIKKLFDVSFINLNLKYLNLEKNVMGLFDVIKMNQNNEVKNESIRNMNVIVNVNKSKANEEILQISIATQSLTAYIIISGNLLHLNLSNTKLTFQEIDYLTEGINLSCSLMSVHLTGNLLTSKDIQKISQKLKAKKSLIDKYAYNPQENALNDRLYHTRQIGQYDHKECMELKKWQDEPILFITNLSENEESNTNDVVTHPIIYYRIIDPDINMSHQNWIESKHCWICERWHKIIINYPVDSTCFIDGQLNEQRLVESNTESETVSNISLVGSSIISQSDNKKPSEKSVMPNLETNIPKVIKPELVFMICGTFTCGKDIPINYDSKEGKLMFINYIPSGLHKYQIKQENTLLNTTNLLVETELFVNLRDQDIQSYRVKIPENNSVYKKRFYKQRSVFKDFRSDNEMVFKRCLEADWRYVKIHRIMRKTEEINKIKESILENYEKIKGIFLYKISKCKTHPTINWTSFLELCNELNAFDDRLSIQEINRIFIITNLEENVEESEINAIIDNSGYNPKNELCRSEFIEILIRLAIAKYYDSKICATQFDAWEQFYYGHIRKIKSSEIYYEFYRNTKIHTIRIDELLKLNLDCCELFYYNYRDIKGLKFDKLHELLNYIGIDITFQDFTYIATHSKVTIIDEMREGFEHTHLTFVEFLEFLVRLADFIYDEEKIKLHKKLERILAKLFQLINQKLISLVENDSEFEN